jgi:hypothetical protein
MRKLALYALMISTALIALAVVLFCTLGLLMMMVGDCGVTMFDFPNWPLQLLIILAIPIMFVFVAVKVWRYCARQLPFRSLR